MATPDRINELSTAVLNIKNIDKDKILRSSLGEESLAAFEKDLIDLIKKGEFAVQYGSEVSDNYVTQAFNTFNQIYKELNTHATRTNAEFVTQREQFLQNIKNSKESIKNFWFAFTSAALEVRGFLEDEGIRKEYQHTVQLMEEKANENLSRVREQAEQTIAEAKKLANEIEGKARQTAAKISIKDAQDQFTEAQKLFNGKVKLWGYLSITSLVIFIVLAYILSLKDFSGDIGFAIYHTVIRLTILTAIGATATFCLRIFRAQLHMRELNLHRQRVANSLSSFVESASTPEQRDLILTHLIESIVNFGNSGLLTDSEDSISPTKLTIDSITRNITLQNK